MGSCNNSTALLHKQSSQRLCKTECESVLNENNVSLGITMMTECESVLNENNVSLGIIMMLFGEN